MRNRRVVGRRIGRELAEEGSFARWLVDLGGRIRFLRIKRDWSIERASAATGISVRMIKYGESGRHAFSLKSLWKFAAAFGADVRDLLPGATNRAIRLPVGSGPGVVRKS